MSLKQICNNNVINEAIAGLILETGYSRWKEHGMQIKAYDNEEKSIDRVIRSILSWEAHEKAAVKINKNELHKLLENIDTAKAEDLIIDTVTDAYYFFDKMYK